jgi:cytochrome P450
MWIILEIVKDPNLFKAVREEVNTVCTNDAPTKRVELHAAKVTSLPLLQSVFTEILRLHVNFNLMRSVNEPVRFDGITLPTGSLVQAPMKVAHFDESVWGRPEHPASEFWAERHINVKDGKRIFSMAGRPSAYFPFGMCILPSNQSSPLTFFFVQAAVLRYAQADILQSTKFLPW